MTSASPGHRRKFSGPGRIAPTPHLPSDSYLRPSKLLLNVTVENCAGAVQVVMSAEDTVADLIKAALAFYQKEKRRPFLKTTDANCYDLHYSSFTLESLKADDELLNLGSRNFFLCFKPATSSCFQKHDIMPSDSAFPWMLFVPLML
ncbi:hypothetical protein Fmac_026006 [Flemingia macrophylla]|uniref:DUF7054 domain-containing protein n=1 Tax=Flemingia macrophylla TaxID=520843 RepID=A0ABD1LDM1_9FABA